MAHLGQLRVSIDLGKWHVLQEDLQVEAVDEAWCSCAKSTVSCQREVTLGG